MKKNFVFYLLAAMIILALPACKKEKKENTTPDGGGETSNVTTLDIRNNNITLAEGESVTLSIKVDPVDATVTFKSSDESVAAVDANGTVYGVSKGEAKVVASAGDKTAECQVTVVSPWDALAFNSLFCYVPNGSEPLYTGVKYTYEVDGQQGQYNMDIYEGIFWVFSEGFYLNSEGEFDGTPTGYLIEFKAPMLCDEKYQYVLGEWGVYEPSETSLHRIDSLIAAHKVNYPDEDIPREFYLDMVGKPGKVDETQYKGYLNEFFKYYNLLAEEGFPTESANRESMWDELDKAAETITGATMFTMEYHTTAEGYKETGYYNSSLADAIVTDATFITNDNGSSPISKFMIGTQYIDLSMKIFDGVYGFDITEDEETGKIEVLNPDEIDFFEYHFESGAMPQSAPRKLIPIKTLNKAQYDKLQQKLHRMDHKTNKVSRIRK